MTSKDLKDLTVSLFGLVSGFVSVDTAGNADTRLDIPRCSRGGTFSSWGAILKVI